MQSSTSSGKSNDNLHQRRTQSPDEEDLDPIVAGLGEDCGRIYAKLEECLADNDRDWRRCQSQVHALKACHEKNAQHPKPTAS